MHSRPDDSADAALLQLIAAQDRPALRLLYDRRSGLCYSLILQIVRHPRDAEEVTADLFLKIWQRAGQYQADRGSALGWIITMARRMAIDRIRSRSYQDARREESLETMARAEEETAGGDGDSWDLAKKSLLSGALEKLHPTHRELLHLSYYEGMSHTMIAERTQTPLGTVKTRIREAMHRLRELLQVHS